MGPSQGVACSNNTLLYTFVKWSAKQYLIRSTSRGDFLYLLIFITIKSVIDLTYNV